MQRAATRQGSLESGYLTRSGASGGRRALKSSAFRSRSSIRFGNASYAGKTSNEAVLSYSSAGVLCKEGLERVLREPAPRERARRLCPSRERLPLLTRSLRLRRQAGQGLGGDVCGHALPLEVGTDPVVAVAAGGKLLRASRREARIVDVPCGLERLDRLGLRLGGDTGPVELRAQGRGRVVPPSERPDGPVQRVLPLATRR
jgi:hypothetical protein